MRYKLRRSWILGGLLAGCVILAQQAGAITLNFSSNPNGSVVTFSGGAFSFTPGAGTFSMAIGSGGSGTSIGDFAQIGGSWTFNAGGITGGNPGTLTIEDGGGIDLTASLSFHLIQSSGSSGLGGIGETTTATINVSNIKYTGLEPDLQQLVTDKSANLNVTFQFTPGLSLTQLASGTHTTSFSVTLTSIPTTKVPDGGSSLAMLGFALLTAEGLRRKLAR